MSPSPPSHVQQQHRFSNSSSPVSSSQLSEDDDNDDEGAPRSDVATVGSNRSVIGDILESSFATSIEPAEHPPPPPAAARGEPLSHETVSSRHGHGHGQLPPLYPAAAAAAVAVAAADSTTSSTSAFLFARAGMQPPVNRAQVMPLLQRGGGVHVLPTTTTTTTTRTAFSGGDPNGLEMLARETGNRGAVATATSAGVGGGSQSGASSIKSCGSITGSETEDRGETTLTTVDMTAAEDVAAAHNHTDSEDDHDCGGSLDVETHSVATIRSLHSQLFQEHEDQFAATDDAASVATATASNPASPRASPNREQHEQQLPQGMASSQEDDTTPMARHGRSRSPDRDESQGKSSRVRR